MNGDFEADVGSVPGSLPAGWKYADYYGYGVQPNLMNFFEIGNGDGGTVGVKFPNWNDCEGWKAALVQLGPVISTGGIRVNIHVHRPGLAGRQ